MNTILFPTDFSECANEAQKVAFSLAKLFSAELRIVHVVSDTIFKWESEKHFSDAVETFPLLPKLPRVVTETAGANRFEEAVAVIEQEGANKGIKTSSVLLFGNSADKILEEAQKVKASLIVMGTNGASGLKEAFVGSVTQWVTRNAPCPVLSLRKTAGDSFKVDNLIYASDFRVESENDNLEQVKILAGYLDASVHLLYINTPHYFEDTTSCVERITKVAIQHGIKNYKIEIYNHFTVEDGVLSYANLNNVDLIAVSNHHYGLLKSIVEFRTTEVLVNHAKVPVLTLNV
ncbi:MAG: universal stress protein [Flavobacteriales bacterium]|jgi:nucleotide-binding universal stress UspA family protein|nr:universal stress protein [Flavobacteriales bacterium]